MAFEFMRRHHHPTRREDEIAGTRPALIFAAGLGLISGVIAVGLFAAGIVLIGHFGGLGTGTHGLLMGALSWLAFWVGLSLGLAGGLALGYRVWARVARPYARRTAAAAARDEERAAVRAAEALIHETSHRSDR